MSRYSRVVQQLAPACHPVRSVLESLPRWDIRIRKALLTLSRVQVVPLAGSLVADRLKDELRSYVSHAAIEQEVRFRDICMTLGEYITSPVLSGFLSMFVRSAPFLDQVEAIEEIQAGIIKEIRAARDDRIPAHLNFNCFLSSKPTDWSFPIAEGYPVSWELHREIYVRFQKAKRDLSSMLFYPDYSQKTLGKEARHNLDLHIGSILDVPGREHYSTWGLEVLYHRTGLMISGATEMRWAWKFNDLKPRTYYARGPDQYYSSRYVQAIWNVFVDEFPNTHRFSRFFTSHIRGSMAQTPIIYDYASFTSLLNIIRQFTSQVADGCSDVQISLVDTRRGVIRVSLKELLDDFNEACNMYPRFRLDGLTRIFDLDEEELILFHTCGMLGVPGNISSCTLLHGLHLAIICGSLLSSKVVGDDAFLWHALGINVGRDDIHQLLSGLGDLSLPKMQFWGTEETEIYDDTTWHYVKRPIDRVDSNIFTGHQYIWPSIPVLLGWSDSLHTVFPEVDMKKKMRKFSSSMLSFVLQFQYVDLEDTEVEAIDRFVRVLNAQQGILEYEHRVGRSFIRPHAFRPGDVQGDVIDQMWCSVVTIPEEFHASSGPIEWMKCIPHINRSSKALKLARDMGYATVEPRMRNVIVEDAEEDIRRWMSKKSVPAYDVCIHENIPQWMYTLYTGVHPEPEEYLPISFAGFREEEDSEEEDFM